jgi:hypothetical protein
MLRKPSEVLKSRSVREYAIDIYRQLLSCQGTHKDSFSTSPFAQRFHLEQDASKCRDYVISCIKKSLEQPDIEEEFFLLPPMFCVANQSAMHKLPKPHHLITVFFCHSGPIVPVVCIKGNYSLQRSEELLASIIRLYSRSSHEYINPSNIHTLLDDK